MIEIFGRNGCSYCDRAISLAEKLDVDFTYKKLDTDFTREQLFEQFPGAKTFPQIRIDGEAIGGYTEFLHYSHGV